MHGMAERDDERNRMSARVSRYARVGANVGGVAARIAGARLFGMEGADQPNAAALTKALGGLKGPIMKVAQLMATIPDVLPPEYAEELSKLQSEAPPMGPAFVKRRMMAELGPDWQNRFGSLRAAAPRPPRRSGRSTAPPLRTARALACKLQYPDMQSAVEADLSQLEILFALHRRMDPAIDTREIAKEIGARVREELDYRQEAATPRSIRAMLAEEPRFASRGIWPELSTARLLTIDWLEGEKLLDLQGAQPRGAQPHRDRHVQGVVAAVQPLRRDPWRSAPGQLHGILGGRRAAGHQSAGLWLHPHLPAAASWAASSISTRACSRTTAIASCTPTRHGASRA